MIVLIAIKNQGDNPSKFKEIGDNGCTSCNKISAQAQKMYTHYKKFLAVVKS
ncbi:hypothetical protein [Campylobacter concisus]|uniref:hypothetical protein n=1 Tax=Campylobacter concisus TaxID=199 RepID=UPI001E390F4E|nr:hypothetical protein [Campylobacter concisus]